MLTEIRARLSRPMPQFWKKLQKRTAATSAAFGTLTVLVSSFSSHLPPVLPTVLGYLTAFFGAISATCTLAVDDPATLPTAEPAPLTEPTTTP